MFNRDSSRKVSREKVMLLINLMRFDVLRWKEALDLTSQKYRRPLLGLIEHLPDCVPVLFDRCITRSYGDQKHRDFHVSSSLLINGWM